MLSPDPVYRHATDRPIDLPWWRRHRVHAIVALLVIAAAALLVASLDSARRLRMERSQLGIALVTRGTFSDFVPLRARVVPRETIYLDATEGGRVDRVMVEPGDMVTAGQPLVRLAN